jgi:hypothetical protein
LPRAAESDTISVKLDPQRLLEARLLIGRLGERDLYNWWATDGVLGPDGAFVGPRVLPRTHPTARARIVFAVAAHSCAERYPDPRARHLFRLDPRLEDRLDALLAERLPDREWWRAQMARLEGLAAGVDISTTLIDSGLVTERHLAQVRRLKTGPAERSLPIPEAEDPDEGLGLLTAGFARSGLGALAVPHLVRSA